MQILLTRIVRVACGTALLLFCTAVCAAAGLDDGLVGHWRFDGCDGKTLKDHSSRGNHGLIDAGQLCTEKGATSIAFDGLGGHVLIREQMPLGFKSAITTVLWVKAVEGRNNTVLFGIPHTTESWTTPVFGMYLSEGRVVYGMWGKSGSGKILIDSGDEMPLDVWTMLAATYDGATVRLYFNDTLVGAKPHSGNLTHNGQPLIIGKGLGHSKPSLKGRVGELRLYDRALTNDEIRRLFDMSKNAYDLGTPEKPKSKDGTVIVESHGSRPDESKPWRQNPTRLLEKLADYKPSGDQVKVNQYGGRTDRPQEKATGFFYTKKIGDRHWLIDPTGCRYYNVGMNTAREPKDVRKHFGSEDQWAEKLTATLRANGFNALGNGNSPRLVKVQPPLVWVLRKNFMFTFAKEKGLTEPASGTVGFLNRCMPVFHPDFEPFCEKFGQDLAATADEPFLLGIMTDNELQCPVDLLDRYLALEAANPDLKPGRDAAAAWLAARNKSAGDKTITLRDRYEFIAFAFERYYRIVTKVIRKHDPHHLYLGSRINYHRGQFDNPYFWKTLARYHDCVSVNYYHFWGPEPATFADWEAWAGRPIIITEWYAKAMDVPGLANTHGAGWLVRTQEDRARYYQHFALRALETKNIVGWHWFKYLDDPKESVALDSAGGANKGMFDIHGQPYMPLVERARAVNREVYPLIEFFDVRRP